MKLNKVILAGAALVAAVSFIGCGKDEDEHGLINNVTNGSVSYTNEDADIVRGFKTTKTKHEGGTAIITLSPESGTGQVGYMWNVKQADDKTYSFLVATFKYQEEANKSPLKTYVSYYTGVNADVLDGGNNFKCICGDEIPDDGSACSVCGAKETKFIPNTGNWVGLTNPNNYKNPDGSYTIVVNADMQPAVDTNGNYATDDPAFIMKFATKAAYDAATVENGKKKLDDADNLEGSVERTIKASQCGLTGESSMKQGYLGMYVAVKSGKTLNASWQLCDVKGEPIVDEE